MKSNTNHNAGRIVRNVLAVSSILFVFSCVTTNWGNYSTANAFEIRVRAKSQLTVDVVTAGTNLQIYGHLRDDLQQTLPQRQIVVHITPASAIEQGANLEHVLLTDRRGQFELTQELAPDFYHVAVEFSETEHLDSSVSLHDVEIKPHPVELSTRAPNYVHTNTGTVLLSVHALVQQAGLSTDVQIQNNQNTLGSIHLDRFGRGALDVREMLSPGNNSFDVFLPPTRYRDAVRKPLTIRLGNQLQLQAQANKVLERLVRGVSIVGNVHDESGPVSNLQVRVILKPLNNTTTPPNTPQPVSIFRSAQTNEDGKFNVFVPNSEMPDANWTILAETIPDVGPTVSHSLESIELNHKLSRKILQLSVAAVILALLLIISQRFAVHLKTRRRTREKRIAAKTALDAALRDHEIIQIIPVIDNFETRSETNANDTFKAPTSQTLAGIVWNAWQKQPVPGATLIFHHAKKPDSEYLTAQSDTKGRFLIESLPPDSYILSVHAVGFIPAKLAFDIPHNGTLSKFRLDLVAVPLKIRQIYQTTIQSIQGEDLWGQQTPRQINELITRTLALETTQSPHMHKRLLDVSNNPAEVLRTLTEIVEECYFSGRLYNEELWLIARELAREIIEFARQHNANQESA